MRTDKRIFALGFFDGVHLGHQALLRECCALAAKQDCQAAAITFNKHPQSLFLEQPPVLINTEEDRRLLLRRFGIGPIYQYPVVKEIMSMPWQAFLQNLLDCGAVGFVCGEDFRFGYRGEGNAEKIRGVCEKKGIPCVVVPEQTLDGVRISSTHIRGLLEAGEMKEAVRFLGHPHILTGKVVHGHQLGRKLGIPTANLMLPEELIVPRFGVYACIAIVDGVRYPAVTNIGTRPTVAGIGITVEPWILDYQGDLYDREITLEFYRFLRPEQKFSTLQALQQEIRRNADETREILKDISQPWGCT